MGIGYSSQTQSADAGIGAAGAAPSYDIRNVYNAAIDYANKHGQFAGRSLKPIYYDYNVANDRSTEDQAACSRFEQDNKSFVLEANTDILRACAEKAGGISLGLPPETVQTFQSYPHYVDPVGIRDDRLGAVTVNGLFSQQYFTGKLGLVTWDDPKYRYAMTHSYLPALAAHGISPATDPIYVTPPQTVGAVADTSAGTSSAVQKFKVLGVDHVMIIDGAAGYASGDVLTFEFMNQAKSQQYYPRYGGNSNNGPGFVANPPDEENNGLYVDQSDYDPAQDAGYKTNAVRDKCFKIQSDAGYPAKNQNDEGISAQVCDAVFFLQQVINHMTVLSANNFVQTVNGLGSTFPTASVYGSRFDGQRRDGGSLVRVETYQSSCQCLKYLGAPYDAS